MNLKEFLVLLSGTILSVLTVFLTFRLGLLSNWMDYILSGFLLALIWINGIVKFLKM